MSGFSFRSALFWVHLVCGLAAGIVIFSMSLTGVILTYERQILDWSERNHYVPEAQQAGRLSLEQLTAVAQSGDAEFTPDSVTITSDPGAAVTFRAGRFSSVSLNPYTGEEMETISPGLENFFRAVTSFHRWFSLQGESRTTARWVTGISNLLFLFLIVSGLYLWLPKFWRWRQFRTRLTFLKNPPSSKARDFNWHHVFGIWAAIPLIVVVYTGAVFFFAWPGDLLNAVFAAESTSGNPGPARARDDRRGARAPGAGSAAYLSLDQLYSAALTHARTDWNTLSISLPGSTELPSTERLSVSVDWGNGAQAHKRETLVLDRRSGELLTTSGFSDMPTARKVRGVVRFLHTGEVLGIVGQTVAGLVSAVALMMVWTGFALSYRRLIQPLFKNKAKPQ